MLKFFVENRKEIVEIGKILRACDFSVRKKGMAKEDEICFFYDESKKGMSFNAHKIIREEIPFFLKDSPFIVRVGRNWNKRGLLTVVEGYVRFFKRGLPIILFEKIEQEEIISIAKNCIVLPWGGFPKEKQNQADLVFWLEWASIVIESNNLKYKNSLF